MRYQEPETGRFVANPNVERVEKPVGVEKKGKAAIKGSNKVNNTYFKNINEFILGNKDFDEVLDDYAQLYAEKINSNEFWSWGEDISGAENLTLKQKRLIKDQAMSRGYIPKNKINRVEGSRYGFADFSGAGVVEETVFLPEKFWLLSDREQFKWLDEQIGGHREGRTWHHTKTPGKMELYHTEFIKSLRIMEAEQLVCGQMHLGRLLTKIYFVRRILYAIKQGNYNISVTNR